MSSEKTHKAVTAQSRVIKIHEIINTTVQRLLTATPEQRPEPLIRPNNKVPANFALVLMISLLPIAVTPVIRITASSPGPDKTSNAGTTASGRPAMCFSHLVMGDRPVEINWPISFYVSSSN